MAMCAAVSVIFCYSLVGDEGKWRCVLQVAL